MGCSWIPKMCWIKLPMKYHGKDMQNKFRMVFLFFFYKKFGIFSINFGWFFSLQIFDVFFVLFLQISDVSLFFCLQISDGVFVCFFTPGRSSLRDDAPPPLVYSHLKKVYLRILF